MRQACHNMTVQQAIVASADRTFIALVLAWLNKAGPFWDDDRQANEDDYFHFEGIDVTDQGLGEAARRALVQREAGTFSFAKRGDRFARTPLDVNHGLEEEPLGVVSVPNFWELDNIVRALYVAPSSWQSMLDRARDSFDGLIFQPNIQEALEAAPFDAGISQRILELLAVLQEIYVQTTPDSSLTDRGVEVLQKHFVGEKAWFTDESERNKQDFKEELTFVDPQNSTATLFCPWHGKVKKGQFRIHFDWPRPKQQHRIKIVYIGPKITKR